MPVATLPNRISTRGSLPRLVPLRRARFWVICLFFLVWLAAITSRLFWLQIVQHHEYIDRAEKQQQRTFEVAPRRGILYDRNLRELAMTVQVDSIYAVPSAIDDKQQMAATLASIVHTDPEDNSTTEKEIAARLAKNNDFAWIARRVTPDVSEKIKALHLKGIYFQKEFQRFYPDNEIAAQVLGYVGTDDAGLAGIEKKYEPELHGAPGRMFTAMDARRRILGSTERDPQPGKNLVLTIDENIQFIAERALDHAMERTHADDGTVIIQDVHTGQILALAIRPTFNPNDRHITPALLLNHAVSDAYEPGSVFKLVTYSAALDTNQAKPTDMIDCQGGQITLAGRVIHDDKSDRGMGVVSVATALARSSDVAAVKLALRVGDDRFYQYIRSFGFGARTGVALPGETRGLLRPPSRWSGSSIGSLAIGQEVGVTPIQLVTMVSTIANGGVYLPPRILTQGKVDADGQLIAEPFKVGEEVPNPLPPGAHRVISEMTAAQMRQMMEGVVLNGTGKPAQLDGYSSGGKTGTAQKIDPATHRYSKTMHIASFAGIAPVNDPAIAVAVVIDNPKGGLYYGTEVSAPVFAEVAQQVLEYLGVPHDQPLRAEKTPAPQDKPVAEDEDQDASQDVNALYSAINDLPSDDPLRQPQSQQNSQSASQSSGPEIKNAAAVVASANAAATPQAGKSAPQTAPSPSASSQSTVTVQTGHTLKVPSLIGMDMRQVIVASAAAGLQVDITGNGIVREQAPAPGTMVAPGTRIVVHCAR